MAMLAEPRFKRKISINPNGNAWSNDETKFGQKLMKKYGWSEGKGLGVKEDGNPDHVKVEFKFGNKGVGYKHNHSDNWIAHQDDFNAILANLNEGSTEEAATVSSIESTSKKSRSRVHYQKFVQGKDLSRRSASDLDSIFGVRSKKKTQEAGEEDDITTEDKPKEDHGSIVTFNSTDSLQEYFAKKMAARKGGNQQSQKVLETVTEQDFEENESTTEKRKKKKKRKADSENCEEKTCERKEDKHVRFSLGEEVNELGSKVKKAKKRKSVEAVEASVVCDDSNVEDCKELVKKSKKSKRKGRKESCENVESMEIQDDISECVKKSKKSKKKEKETKVPLEENVISGDNECAKESKREKKEKGKKKGKGKSTEESVETVEKVPVKRQLENADDEEVTRSKKKKSKQGELGKSGTTDGRAKRVVFDSEGNFEGVHEVEESSVQILKESYMKTFMPNYTEKLKAGSKVKRTSEKKLKKKTVKSSAKKTTSKPTVEKPQEHKSLTKNPKQNRVPARNARKNLPGRQLGLRKTVGGNKRIVNNSSRKQVPLDKKASQSTWTLKRSNEKRTVQDTWKKGKPLLTPQEKRKMLEQAIKTKLPSIVDVFKSKGASVHTVGGLYEKPVESEKQAKTVKSDKVENCGKKGGKSVTKRNFAKKGKQTVPKGNSEKLLTKKKGQTKTVKKTSNKPKAFSDVEKEKIEQIHKRTGKTLTRHQLKKSLWYAKQKLKT
ncbi:micronuclear linker histone polyprotein-like [Saccostrea cucullata]|uniref:micronuclear linker histone polyprotein-like n=1 Tax=Saccostrea cuccullata TaxID=36930 RepID=UPI002ED2DAEB